MTNVSIPHLTEHNRNLLNKGMVTQRILQTIEQEHAQTFEYLNSVTDAGKRPPRAKRQASMGALT